MKERKPQKIENLLLHHQQHKLKSLSFSRQQPTPSTIPPMLLQQLPQDALEHIAFHLEAPDLLSFLSSSRFLNESLGTKVAFWRNLLWQREGTTTSSSSPFACSHDDMLMQQQEEEDDIHNNAKSLKEQFLRAAYCKRLTNVQWCEITATRSAPSEREGHGCCLLGDDDNPILVITGGFTGDPRVYIKELHGGNNNNNDWHPITPTIQFAVVPGQPEMQPQLFAYGASLTRLNATTAVRFGGFTSGGYTHETSLVAVLTIAATKDSTNDGSSRYQATWRLVPPKFAATSEQEMKELIRFGCLRMARAYHTATLLENRYLYIVGGMKSRGSVLDPICLDCETWTWILHTTSSNNNGETSTINTTAPSGRHGHSVVWDRYRKRLVLFGGGSGSDLLRSGQDNSEVWEFKNTTATAENASSAAAAATAPSSSATSSTTTMSPESFLAKIKSCQWRLIHQDQNQHFANNNNDSTTIGVHQDSNQGGAYGNTPNNACNNNNRLRPVETLNLGRCHAAHHVARDTVILLFGSGKPSTNSILAYNLQTDSFFRPKLLSSSLVPCPRFTFGSVFIPRLGYIFVHGGFSTQYRRSIVEMALLHLSPPAQQLLDDDGFIRRLVAFGWATLQQQHAPRTHHAPVTDQHVLAIRNREQQNRLDSFLLPHQHAMRRPVVFPESDDDDDDDSSNGFP